MEQTTKKRLPNKMNVLSDIIFPFPENELDRRPILKKEVSPRIQRPQGKQPLTILLQVHASQPMPYGELFGVAIL